MFNHLNAQPSYRMKSRCVTRLRRCITTLCFQLLRTHWVSVWAKNSIRNTPASTALTQVLHQSHNVCTANLHLCSNGERNGAQRKKNKVSFGRTMIQVLELLRWQKSTSQDKMILNSEEIKPVAIARGPTFLKSCTRFLDFGPDFWFPDWFQLIFAQVVFSLWKSLFNLQANTYLTGLISDFTRQGIWDFKKCWTPLAIELCLSESIS